MDILETRNLCFAYEQGKEILHEININIRKGSFTTFLGANGCGKTTLIQHLNGLIKPTSGQVLLRGSDLKQLKDSQIYSSIGLVFQNPDDQLFAHTVFEDVAYGLNNLGIQGADQKTRIENALQLMDISQLKDMEIHKLSFGQKKRVAIAGVLAMKPDILILDEPTAGLDPMTTSSLIKTLKEIQEHEGVTVIIATHEVDIVPVSCDYAYVLNNGRVLLEGIPVEVFRNKKALRDANLRLPRIGHLMEILHEIDHIDIDTSAMSISSARKAIKKLMDTYSSDQE
ncbi:MAG: cobalt transporter, ATPase subunit [Clostridiales bacterium]|nr:cobalt transporter, ATPase subunit [Clostridiales bacterium]